MPDLLESIEAFLADKAYDAQERVLDPLEKAGVQAVSPPKKNRKEQRAEPPREFRRLIAVSHAAMADSVSRR